MLIRCLQNIFKASLIVLLLSVAGCRPQTSGNAPTKAQENQNIVNQRTQVVEEAQKKREDRAKQLKALDVPQLAAELSAESQRGLEPFNSSALREMVSRGESAAPALASVLTKPDRSSLLGLLALRKMSASHYKELNPDTRVSILVDALKTSKYFNTWGLPHESWEEAAKSLIEEGRAAQKPLTALLTDKRDAPVWGEEDYAEYLRYKYRVCDYAWAMLLAIANEKVTIPENPAERDRLEQKLLEGQQSPDKP